MLSRGCCRRAKCRATLAGSKRPGAAFPRQQPSYSRQGAANCFFGSKAKIASDLHLHENALVERSASELEVSASRAMGPAEAGRWKGLESFPTIAKCVVWEVWVECWPGSQRKRGTFRRGCVTHNPIFRQNRNLFDDDTSSVLPAASYPMRLLSTNDRSRYPRAVDRWRCSGSRRPNGRDPGCWRLRLSGRQLRAISPALASLERARKTAAPLRFAGCASDMALASETQLTADDQERCFDVVPCRVIKR